MKKAYFIFCLLLFTYSGLKAQTYQELIEQADELLWKETDTVENAKKAFVIYEKAMGKYPQQQNFWNLYYAAYAANKVGEIDKGFEWLSNALEHKEEYDVGIITKDAAQDFNKMIEEERWMALAEKVGKVKRLYIKELKDRQKSLAEKGMLGADFFKTKNAKKLYTEIKGFNNFPELGSDKLLSFVKINDSLDETFFVRIPSEYNPQRANKVLIYLNGAVRYQNIPDYPNTNLENGFQRFYKKYAEEFNVIMVYPDANKEYNWMLGDKGFFMVPAILRELKKFINIDDDQVFVTGHSNGATGSFSYLMKNPSEFAAFYGFNTQPKVYTGGTFIKNILNRSFYNVSTDQDYYFPPEANDTLTKLMRELKADYSDHRYEGFPHWFPQFAESEPAFKAIFEDLEKKERNPFQKKLFWETDDVKNGKVDWLEITQLDTLQPKKEWHKQINFDIHKWLYYENKTLKVKDTLRKAFDFPRKSGAVSAEFVDNTFRIKTSRVGKISVLISPEMVDMTKPVSIYVNGEIKYHEKPKYNREFILDNFRKYYDRKALWVQEIELEL